MNVKAKVSIFTTMIFSIMLMGAFALIKSTNTILKMAIIAENTEIEVKMPHVSSQGARELQMLVERFKI